MRQALNALFKGTLAFSASWCGASMCGHANILQSSVSVCSQLIRLDGFINLGSR